MPAASSLCSTISRSEASCDHRIVSSARDTSAALLAARARTSSVIGSVAERSASTRTSALAVVAWCSRANRSAVSRLDRARGEFSTSTTRSVA